MQMSLEKNYKKQYKQVYENKVYHDFTRFFTQSTIGFI